MICSKGLTCRSSAVKCSSRLHIRICRCKREEKETLWSTCSYANRRKNLSRRSGGQTFHSKCCRGRNVSSEQALGCHTSRTTNQKQTWHYHRRTVKERVWAMPWESSYEDILDLLCRPCNSSNSKWTCKAMRCKCGLKKGKDLACGRSHKQHTDSTRQLPESGRRFKSLDSLRNRHRIRSARPTKQPFRPK
jgi:hypothetical protein